MGKDYCNCVSVGRLVADPDVKVLSSKNTLVKFRLAVSNDYYDKESEAWVNQSDFFDFVLWGDRSASFADRVGKGDKILVEWRPRNNNYEKDGSTVYNNDFVVSSFQVIERKSSGASVSSTTSRPPAPKSPPSRPADFDEEDAPF